MSSPRANENGIYNNPYWYDNTYNAGAQDYTWMANCTTYAYGRSVEIAGGQIDRNTIFGSGFPDAKNWYNNALWTKSASKSDIREGDILCWGPGGGVGNFGHVAVVEKIDGDGKIWISQSHYNSQGVNQTRTYPSTTSKRYFEYGYYDTSTDVIHVTYYYNSAGTFDYHYSTIYVPTFNGTIHNPYAGSGSSSIIPVLMLMKKRKERRSVRVRL